MSALKKFLWVLLLLLPVSFNSCDDLLDDIEDELEDTMEEDEGGIEGSWSIPGASATNYNDLVISTADSSGVTGTLSTQADMGSEIHSFDGTLSGSVSGDNVDITASGRVKKEISGTYQYIDNVEYHLILTLSGDTLSGQMAMTKSGGVSLGSPYYYSITYERWD